MNGESLNEALERVRSLETEVVNLRRTLDRDDIDLRDRDYLSRCFDLLDMELDAVRQYLGGLA